MKWLRGAGLVLGAAAVWTLALSLTGHSPMPLPLGIFTAIAALGLPAFFAGPLAYRWRLPLPEAWAAAGYCLGSGAATAVLYLLATRGEPVVRYLQVALAHAASLTILMPLGEGFTPQWVNLIRLAIVVVIARYGVEAYKGDRPRADQRKHRK
jgi:drug/metabolite transporter (DMT)-like permease